MRLLLTNDDGIDAPGLAALCEAARGLGELVVVAPHVCHSSGSHRVTTDAPIRLARLGGDRFAVEGTPADCVRIALSGLAGAVDAVLAGINAGGNLGADVYVSGTVAAAREAALLGRPAIAVSQYRKRGLPFDWARAATWVAPLLRDLLARPWQPGSLWNVNLPHLEAAASPPVVFCPLDWSPLPIRFDRDGDHYLYAGDYHNRPRRQGSDVDVCFAGRISVTRLVLHGALEAECGE
jgi:5'-nucleotidase